MRSGLLLSVVEVDAELSQQEGTMSAVYSSNSSIYGNSVISSQGVVKLKIVE